MSDFVAFDDALQACSDDIAGTPKRGDLDMPNASTAVHDGTPAPSHSAAAVQVEAPCGRLLGLHTGAVNVFRGIPYAQPPVGPLRWAPPERLAPWAGVRDALTAGACAPQNPSLIDRLLPGQIGRQAEDCLCLDLWAPCGPGRRPVMVWILGGAFMIGAGNSPVYDGSRLAARGDVVVVAINYRLGSLGFLNLRDATDGAVAATGNEGLMDQIAALEWVRDNIASFGGDPGNVTVFGESAGALSIGCLLAMPRARGLFHKAILQSGAAHVGYPREKSARVGRAMLDIMGIAPDRAAQVAESPVEAIMAAQLQLMAENREQGDPRKLGTMPYGPVLDDGWLPERPIEAIRAGAGSNVATMVGTMRDEYRLFSVGDARLRALDEAALQAVVHATCGAASAQALLQAYADGSPFDRVSAVMGERLFGLPALLLAQARADSAPAYVFRIDHVSPLLDGIFGACHFLDAGLVFGTHDQAPFFGPGPDADKVSADLMTAWTRFARSGDPSIDTAAPWPTYGEARATMVFGGGPTRVLHLAEAARYTAWQGLGDALGFT